MSNVVTLPDSIIETIDRLVGEEGRDRFVLDVIEAELRRRRMEAFEAVVGSLRDVDVPGWETPESADQWVHDLRRESDQRANLIEVDGG